jgi:G3E family GTPase
MPFPLSELIPKRGMPVTLITGFLDSGKTTLLNHILTNRQDLKVAENMVELSNGCICYTINDDLMQAVYRVLEKRDSIDYLTVETLVD